ncbi:UNVERIFIED_CONTAM: hypothetical protein PYX00_004794 [Menopon gallinae]|uniref:Auxillin n=1 Tax=Menopon gallinae TaxID=328185 RepID=A0AAW2I5T1_9NEOP
MSDLLKSAFGYFNSSSSPGAENDFVGQVVEIGNVKFVVKRVIAEGGFAFIYVVQDPNTSKEYALKRLLASDSETNNNILQEINILKKLSGHPNIIQYLAAAAIDKSEASHGKNEYLVLTEYCTKGNLVECLNNRSNAFPPDVVCRIFWQTCKAVQHMHSQVPPVIHRDLKMDNLLISADGVIKLCDFGSCTLKTHRPDPSWSAGQRSLLEDDMAKFTTPMYRPPEMIDTWNNHPIGPPCDIWALGCILYTLCFMSHPFSDSAKLKILNANFTIPSGDSKYSPFHDIIRGCLKVNPENRMTVSDILERLAAISESMGYDMKEPLNIEIKKNETSSNNHSPVPPHRTPNDQKPSRPQPTRPPPPQHSANPTQPQRPEPPASRDYPAARNEPSSHMKGQPTKHEAGLFSSLKGGAGSFFKNLKDTSNKVMQTVHQSIARSDLDISYITSRILVMPFPADGLELAYKSNHVEDVKAFLEARHPGGRYCVYNLSGRSYPPTRLGLGRVVDSPFGGFRRVPPLHILYNLAADIMNFLERDQRNVVVIHCTDGKASSAILVVSLLMYSGMMEKYEDALQMFAVKRIPPDLQPSEARYLKYMSYMLKNPPILPHTQPVTIVSIILQPVPLFTKLRDGCRPYVELYQGDERIKSTLTEYDRMRVFHMSEGKVMVPLNITVCGDITISIFHARQNLGGVMSSGRPTGHKICQFQFHTGFIQEDDTSLKFTKGELDDIGESDHYQDRFTAIVNIFVCDYSKELRPMPWESHRKVNPEILFGTSLEMDEAYENFVTKPSTPPKQIGKSVVPPPRPVKPPAAAAKVEDKPKEEEVERLVENVTQEADLLAINSTPDITNQTSVNKQESIDLLGLGIESRSESNNNHNNVNKSSSTFSELDDLFKSGPETVPLASSPNVNDADLLIDPFGSENTTTAEVCFYKNIYT